MNSICIPVPNTHRNSTIELEVTIDGRRRVMNYRVETIEWDRTTTSATQISRLRDFVATYDRSWELVQIGRPSGDVVSVTFRSCK